MRERLKEVHRYWFGDYVSDIAVLEEKGKLWFGKDAAVDDYIRERFGDLVSDAVGGRLNTSGLVPMEKVAVVLLLDQFTRNIFRQDSRSFAGDPLARELSSEILHNETEGLRLLEKVFLYLPFEHSEELDDQKKSVALYRQLLETATRELQSSCAGFYDYAVRHHDIIARFGRFPHRNEILQRVSTPEEKLFLEQPGSSF